MKYSVSSQLPPLVNEYDKPHLVCLVKNVHWAYVFWEITDEQLEKAWQTIGYDENAYKMLRVLKGKRHEQQVVFDITIDTNVGSHYLYLPDPGQQYQMEILLVGQIKTVVLLSSNFIITPFGGISTEEDELWSSIDQLYTGFSAELAGIGLTSPLLWSITSPMPKPVIYEEELYLAVDTELILYGKASPGSTVYVQGEAVSTNTDGSFTLRYALSEGCSIFPVKAVTADGKCTKTIVPVITRETY